MDESFAINLPFPSCIMFEAFCSYLCLRIAMYVNSKFERDIRISILFPNNIICKHLETFCVLAVLPLTSFGDCRLAHSPMHSLNSVFSLQAISKPLFCFPLSSWIQQWNSGSVLVQTTKKQVIHLIFVIYLCFNVIWTTHFRDSYSVTSTLSATSIEWKTRQQNISRKSGKIFGNDWRSEKLLHV